MLGVCHNYQHFHECSKSRLFQDPSPKCTKMFLCLFFIIHLIWRAHNRNESDLVGLPNLKGEGVFHFKNDEVY